MRLHPFEHGELHPELWKEVCDRGWPGLLVPSEHGGAQEGLLAYVVMMEALAESNLILWMPVLTAATTCFAARPRCAAQATAS